MKKIAIPRMSTRRGFMFLGEYLHKVDDKGRTIIPLKFRSELGSSFVVAKGYKSKNLIVYPMDEWKKVANRLEEKIAAGEETRRFARVFFAGASECEIDKQGRILVPMSLREYADIKNEVYFIGGSSQAEIWNKEAWNEYIDAEEASDDEIGNAMEAHGM